MATDKYLNLEGLERVASKVNQKLKTVTTIPTNPEKNDIVLYKGSTTNDFIKGRVYLYDKVGTYFTWINGSVAYFTRAEEPQVGDTVYSDTTGTDSGFTVEAYDNVNYQITVDSLLFTRNNAGDTDILGWVLQDTSIILNGTDKTGDEANFYAPTTAGEVGQVLYSKGNNAPPEWASISATGYAPSFIDDALIFTYGVLPEVENNSLIFDLDDIGN